MKNKQKINKLKNKILELELKVKNYSGSQPKLFANAYKFKILDLSKKLANCKSN